MEVSGIREADFVRFVDTVMYREQKTMMIDEKPTDEQLDRLENFLWFQNAEGNMDMM